MLASTSGRQPGKGNIKAPNEPASAAVMTSVQPSLQSCKPSRCTVGRATLLPPWQNSAYAPEQ